MALELTTITPETLEDLKLSMGIYTKKLVFPEQILRYASDNTEFSNWLGVGTIVNFRPLQDCATININASLGGTSLSAFSGAEYLTNLQDLGTAVALNIGGTSFLASTLNQLFSALPTTTKTATINVTFTPGAATCDTTIAQNKGYIVVTT